MHGGRWNREGTAAVYTSASPSLAALEYLTHIDIDLVPADLVLLTLELPDALMARSEVVEVSALPATWQRPEDPRCIALGQAWLEARTALVLSVPSAILPEERNYILNPAHPDMPRVAEVRRRNFAYDPRLLRRVP